MAPPQQPAAPAPERGDAGDRAVKSTSQGKTSKRCRVVPPPIVTDLPPRSASVGSTPRAQSRSPDASAQKDRIGKRAAADLVAQQVLRARMYGSAREYMIRWEGVVQPLWISRRKAPRQAKELIDLFSAELRAQEAEAARRAEAEFYTVDHIVNHRTHYNKRQYQVRWENYDASDDTWENGDKLRADVPDIVDAYEAQLERDQTRAEALESAMSELNRDTAARPKSTAKKRGVAEAKEKRPRIATEKENKGKDGDGGNSDEDDYQFDLEEAELEEFSEDEYADRLHA
ncbi:hypothetical protein PHYSODRAFT_479034 [Phytophthora sojae]|uniref:Chromo domain-containing protein n=1 Tax=Phytophthora sojae (strain P6497) TaxID=1094619 RepID=G4YR92_PHYSP|nr:hypothetical protein PHYSODRAFT_479034 [Phytophthora sojae]EGZ22826.1 hypothetical protein PHYSODRAFT_479034 [Phytophthora sojae]|eukprot:XP_009518114.1 hypothetical protein PHYSODRAFT_479034 [Phytophthora sojae]